MLIVLVWSILGVTGIPYKWILAIPYGTRIFGPTRQHTVFPQYGHKAIHAGGLIAQGKVLWDQGRYDQAAEYFRVELKGPYYD